LRDTTLALIAVAVVFGVVLVAAASRRILLRLSLKNIARRKTRAAIVVLGLLVGTALISSAMVVGDTLEYIFKEDVLQRWGLVDEIVAQETSGVYLPFNESYFPPLRDEIAAMGAPVDGIAPTILVKLTVRNESRDLWAEPVSVIGLNSSYEGGLGDLTAVDGGITSTLDLGQDEAFVNQRLAEKLAVSPGAMLRVYYGQSSFNITVTAILRNEGVANLDKQPVLVMDLRSAQNKLMLRGSINLVRVSNNGGYEDGVQFSDLVSNDIRSVITAHGWNATTNLHPEEVKKDGLDDARQFSKDVTQVFFIMGTFAVVAGILLIINIFVMMAEERKGEMGVSRAVGMTRSQLTQTFLFEGAIYSAASSALGALAGVGLGYVVIYFFSVVVPIGEQGLTVTFHYDASSIVLAFAIGVFITFFTVAIASWIVSRLNIVRAIRGQPEPVPERITPPEALVGSLLLLGSLAAFLARSYPPANIASVPLLILGVIILTMRSVNPRWTSTIGGLLIVAWTLGPKFVEQNEPDLYIPFVLAGLLLVLGGVMFVVFNSAPLLRAVSTLGARRKGHPVLRTALTYPMSKRFRTGMTLGMFSLIMFAVCVMSMIQGMQASAIGHALPIQSGGYDFVAHTGTFQRIDDANWSRGLKDSGVTSYIESISNATVAPVFVHIPGGGDPVPYTLWGVDNVLIKTNEFGFKSVMNHYYDRYGGYHSISEARDAWVALEENDELALIDGNAAGGNQFSPIQGALRLNVGDRVQVSYYTVTKNFTILGILQQSLPGTAGLFVSERLVLGNYSVTKSAYFFQLRPGANTRYVADSLKTQFIQYQMEIVIVAEVLGQIIETADRVLLLMQAYLAIGLIVGIAGMAVVTVRAVVERRQQIGVLRAIGYTKNMVMASFLLEIGFVAVFGSIIGITLGVLLAYRVWSLFFQEVTPFIIPWVHLALVAFLAGVATVLATASPAIRASKIPPAEALRYVE